MRLRAEILLLKCVLENPQLSSSLLAFLNHNFRSTSTRLLTRNSRSTGTSTIHQAQLG